MDFPFRTPDAKTVNPGQFCIPTGPTIGTNVTKSATANTYGSYLEMIASTSAALYITGATVFGDALNTKYLQFMLGTGAGGAETAVYIFRVGNGTTITPLVFDPPIPVATATRIAAKVAGDGTIADVSQLVLLCINQSDVVAM